MSKQHRRQKRHHKTGSWRIAPRKNYMVEALEKLKGWTQYTLTEALKKSLRPERRKRKK